jgi:hypothetical protein
VQGAIGIATYAFICGHMHTLKQLEVLLIKELVDGSVVRGDES